jgi:pyruvate,water dikinase
MRAIDLAEREALDPAAVGHKAANLARFAASFRVPPAFCLSTGVYNELRAALSPEGTTEREALRLCVADAYERLAATLGVRDPRVAVRSSATGEDSADASFAGQHETILNVSGVSAVVEAIFDCWRSAGNERVTAYRKEKGIDAPVQVAVLIQQMVDADVSAIAFGVDPVNGDRDVVIIDAAPGLGDRIAAGEITPDRYTVRKSDLSVTASDGDALSEAQARAIAKLVLALERVNGHEVDVECAFAKDELYLLQCRPITTLAASFPPVEWGHPNDAKLHWRRDDAHLGAPVPRLVTDYIRNGAPFGLARRAEFDDLPVLPRLESFFGRTYSGIERRDPARDMAEHGRSATTRVRARARGWRRIWDDEYVPRLRAHYAWFHEVTREAATLPRAELADRWEGVFPRVNDIWTMHMFTTGAAYTLMDELAQTYEALTGGTTADALKLTQARAPSLQKLARDMHALVTLYASGDTAAFDRARVTFVAEHGNLGSSGEDMRERPWVDDPALLIAELERLATTPAEDPDSRVARLIAEGDAVEARARELLKDRPEDLARFDEVLAAARATGPLTEEHNYVLDRQVNSNVGRLMRAVGTRLERDGLIDDAESVFLFHIGEISDAVREGRPLHALERERLLEYSGWLRLRHPRILGAPTSPFPVTSSNARVDLIYTTTQDTAGLIKGQPASSGVRRGRARLVRSLSDFSKMTKGDILVCRSSNVSWIPLFTIAAAIVTDVGGSLSHAAVVAREFGVPAVVGCAVALDTLRDGQMVEVDGDRGTVRVLTGT